MNENKTSFVETMREFSRGRLEIISGPMFSGKTTEMLKRIRRHVVAGRKSVIFKYEKDKRYEEGEQKTVEFRLIGDSKIDGTSHLITHDGVSVPAYEVGILEEHVGAVDLSEVSVIGIDEGQFYPDVVEFCNRMVDLGKTVVISCLNLSFELKTLGRVHELYPYAEELTMLASVCFYCKMDANFTMRTSSEKEEEVIGGSEKYRPICRSCFKINNRNIYSDFVKNVRTDNMVQ